MGNKKADTMRFGDKRMADAAATALDTCSIVVGVVAVVVARCRKKVR
jgi:hypothetical protein